MTESFGTVRSFLIPDSRLECDIRFCSLIWILDQEWTRNGPEMDKKWTRNGQEMDQKWTRNGPEMDQKWTEKLTGKLKD